MSKKDFSDFLKFAIQNDIQFELSSMDPVFKHEGVLVLKLRKNDYCYRRIFTKEFLGKISDMLDDVLCLEIEKFNEDYESVMKGKTA